MKHNLNSFLSTINIINHNYRKGTSDYKHCSGSPVFLKRQINKKTLDRIFEAQIRCIGAGQLNVGEFSESIMMGAGCELRKKPAWDWPSSV
jgi:hypothetical protein